MADPCSFNEAGASRPSLASYLADLDTGLTERESEDWLRAMRDARGADSDEPLPPP